MLDKKLFYHHKSNLMNNNDRCYATAERRISHRNKKTCSNDARTKPPPRNNVSDIRVISRCRFKLFSSRPPQHGDCFRHVPLITSVC